MQIYEYQFLIVQKALIHSKTSHSPLFYTNVSFKIPNTARKCLRKHFILCYRSNRKKFILLHNLKVL